MTMPESLANLATAAAVVCLATGIGHGILNVIGLRRIGSRERVVFSFAVGVVGMSLAALPLAHLGLLRTWPVRIIMVLLLAPLLPAIRVLVRNLRSASIVTIFLARCSLLEKTLVVIIATQALVILVSIAAPGITGDQATSQDAMLAVHQPPPGPRLVQAILDLGSALQSRTATGWLTPIFIGAAGAAVYLLARRFWPRKVAILAAASFLITPQLASSLQLRAQEAALAFFVVASFLALAIYRRSRSEARTPALVLIALLSGAAAGSSPAGAIHLLLVGPMVFLVPVLLFQEHTRVVLKRFALYAAIAIVLAAGWYAGSWTAPGTARLPIPKLTELATDNPDADLGRTLVSLLTCPWSLTMRVQGDDDPFTGTPGPLPLAFIPLLLLLPDRPSRPLKSILFYCAAYVIYAFFVRQPGQSLLPILGLASVATAVGIDRMERLAPVAARVAVAAVILAYAANVAVSAHVADAAGDRLSAAVDIQAGDFGRAGHPDAPH
ncbi:MAG TPA: hypothetical protein VM223_06590 [Planctomycetota bacterium]|nr:hypothetical protein [Planctomycetota bacterium]